MSYLHVRGGGLPLVTLTQPWAQVPRGCGCHPSRYRYRHRYRYRYRNRYRYRCSPFQTGRSIAIPIAIPIASRPVRLSVDLAISSCHWKESDDERSVRFAALVTKPGEKHGLGTHLREGLARAILSRGVTGPIADELAEEGDAITDKYEEYEDMLRKPKNFELIDFLISSHQRRVHGKV